MDIDPQYIVVACGPMPPSLPQANTLAWVVDGMAAPLAWPVLLPVGDPAMSQNVTDILCQKLDIQVAEHSELKGGTMSMFILLENTAFVRCECVPKISAYIAIDRHAQARIVNDDPEYPFSLFNH